jgi:small conductance mechanosensitive channel
MEEQGNAVQKVYPPSGPGRKRFLLSGLVACLFLLPMSLSAQLSAPSGPKTEEKPPAKQIPIESVADSTLQERLSAVLSSIEDYKNVQVNVENGVVTLKGKALSANVRDKAQELVSRFQGVIHVQNEIEQEAKVESQLAPAIKKINQYLNSFIRQLPVIIIALVIIVLSWFLSGLVTRWDWPFKQMGINLLLRSLIRQFLRTVLFLVGLLIALDILDVTALVGAFVGTAGVLGLAIGFAFRDIVENYLAGMLLSLRSPFVVNDLVLIGAHEGKVLRMTTREIILMTLDGNHLRIPNSTVFKSVIYNYSRNAERRFHFPVGVGTAEDLVRVQEVGCRALEAMEGVLANPAPFMRVEELAKSTVVVRFFGWMDQSRADWFKVNSNAMRLVKKALDEEEIEMPPDTHAVRLQQVDFRAPAAEPKPAARPSAEQEARAADVTVDRRLDEQIEQDLATSDEENLLTEGKR